MVAADAGPAVVPAHEAAGETAGETVAGAERGRLDIAQRAVERIAEFAARSHPGVLRRDAVLGRGLPKARAVIAGRRVRLEVQIAAAWGHRLEDLADDVRRRLTGEVERMTGLGVDRVDVTISAVDLATRTPVLDGLGAAQPVLDGIAAASSEPEPEPEPVAARPPVAAPAAVGAGVLAALGLVALGAVGVMELAAGPVIPRDWFGRTLTVRPEGWMVPVGAVLALLGLLLLIVTFAPRRRTHLAIGGPEKMVWIRPADAARIAADTARRVDSVTGVTAVAKRRALRITVDTFGDPERVRAEVASGVGERLQGLEPLPPRRVLVREED